MNGYFEQKMVVFGVVLAILAVSYGYPMGEQGKNLISGVFIPSEAFKNLQDRANANMQNNQPQNQGNIAQPVTNPQPTYQPISSNPPQYQYQPQQPPVMTNTQPALTNQPMNNQPINTQPITTQPLNNQPINTQPITTQPISNQPVLSNQPTILYAQQMAPSRDPNSNQPIMLMTNQPNNQQPIVYLQQPSNQPIYVQPSQPNQYVFSNGQPNQPTQIVISNPSNSRPNQNQPGTTVYTLIPLTSQNNGNTNTGSYLMPVQSGNGNTNPIILSASH